MAGRPMVSHAVKFRAFPLREQALSFRKIAEIISRDAIAAGEISAPVSHSSVAKWLKDEGLKAAYSRRSDYEKERKAPPEVLTLGVATTDAPLGWTIKAEDEFAQALCDGASKRIASHRAGLTEADIDGWFDEAERGVAPFVGAIMRIRKLVAVEVCAVCVVVKGGGENYQARLRWLAAVDPDNWSDKPRQKDSEQDRADGMDDSELFSLLSLEAIDADVIVTMLDTMTAEARASVVVALGRAA